MADFCQQCSLDEFGKDFRELAGVAYGPLEKDHGWLVLCEGCGTTTVDEEGRCQGNCLDATHGIDSGEGQP